MTFVYVIGPDEGRQMEDDRGTDKTETTEDEAVWPEGTDILHIIAQGAWHDPAWIIGTRSAITALRDALNAALALPVTDGRAAPAVCGAMSADGEHYGVVCRVVSAATMETVPFGYTEDIARGDVARPGWMDEGIAT